MPDLIRLITWWYSITLYGCRVITSCSYQKNATTFISNLPAVFSTFLYISGHTHAHENALNIYRYIVRRLTTPVGVVLHWPPTRFKMFQHNNTLVLNQHNTTQQTSKAKDWTQLNTFAFHQELTALDDDGGTQFQKRGGDDDQFTLLFIEISNRRNFLMVIYWLCR